MQPGLLTSPRVIEWLQGKEPAWTIIAFESYLALDRKPDEPGRAISLSEAATSPMAKNAMSFLAELENGQSLTKTGNLTRAFVARMIPIIDWPGFDPQTAFTLHKVINEPDFLPLHALRIFCNRAKLVRAQRGVLRLTKSGRALVKANHTGRLNREIFEAAFWNTNLAYFDGYPLSPWPQSNIGLALWCLSVVAHDWHTPSDLARLCTIPINGVLDAEEDLSGRLFEARILRPLTWFGLLDVETTVDEKYSFLLNRRYRKAAAFDDFINFDVALELDRHSIQ